MDNNELFEVETSVEENVTGNDLQEKLEEAGTLSEKACIAIGALALAGTVALGNMAWKGGKKAIGWAKGKLDAHKEKKAAKAEDQKEETTEETSGESKEDSKK